MERKADRNFVLAVTFILAATLLSGQMITNPSGLATQPVQPLELGACYAPHSPAPITTTYTNCCKVKPMNDRWVRNLDTTYC
ncbi:hypothetical protein HOF78_00270 [Candidatus Woesearchaeota archaeon]|jgi:hypothetical protein|nr:hypothetical protein [Candidatus Woesearchaeota archaeon]MBT6044599.1 hypothetical protein [Candidatus Woesearchaeota archaeon]